MAESKLTDQSLVDWPFGRKNYLWFAVALVVIVIGYILLGQGSMTLAPILLVVGYCVLIPVAIMVRSRDKESGQSVEESAG